MKKTILLTDSCIHKGALILVNRRYPAAHARPLCLTALRPSDSSVLLESSAARAFWQVLTHIGADNRILPTSGYRPLAEQRDLYWQTLQTRGENFTHKYVAFPGCSEHQTGLAIDVAQNDSVSDVICPAFPDSGICKDFRKISGQYGFIERYASGKELLTGIACEPWHFRYVGYPHAEIIRARGFCLEEYTDYLKQFDRFHPLAYCDHNARFDVFFVPLRGKSVLLELPHHHAFWISGNNTDGVIITCKRSHHGTA